MACTLGTSIKLKHVHRQVDGIDFALQDRAILLPPSVRLAKISLVGVVVRMFFPS